MTNTYHRNKPTDINDTYRIFFEAMQTNSIYEMAKAAEKVFSLPVFIIDKNDKPICRYPQTDIGYSNLDDYFKKGLDTKTREQARIKALSNKPPVFDPFLVNQSVFESDSIFGQIYYNNKLYGYFFIYMLNNPLEKDDLERAKIFADAIGYVFHNQRSLNSYSLSSSLLDTLNSTSNEYERIQATDSIANNIKGKYIVIAKPIAPNANNSTYAVASLNHIHELKLNIVTTIHNNFLVVLYGGINSVLTQSHKDNISKIESFLRPAGIGCGVSDVFNDLYDIRGYFEQAQMTSLCSEKSLEFYNNITPRPIFEFISYYGTAKAFIHPALNEIYKYDIDNKTDYFETLRVYSMFMHNRQQTIAELCIHHNTLIYRLNRIRDIFNLAFEEPQTALHLLNSFQLWDITKNRH